MNLNLSREKHAARRRKLVRRTGAAAVVAALLLMGWFGWQQVKYRAAADGLADRAATLQSEVKQLTEVERGWTWGSVLLGSAERLDKLELATLIAVEAVRRARTERSVELRPCGVDFVERTGCC